MTFRLGVLENDYADALKMVNINRLDKLDDVVEGVAPKDGDTLNYDSVTDTYVVGKIEIDGGGF